MPRKKPDRDLFDREEFNVVLQLGTRKDRQLAASISVLYQPIFLTQEEIFKAIAPAYKELCEKALERMRRDRRNAI